MGVEHRSMVQSAQVQGIVKDAPGEEWEKSKWGINMVCCGELPDS